MLVDKCRAIAGLLIDPADLRNRGGDRPAGGRGGVAKVIAVIEPIPADASTQFKEAPELRRINEIDSNALRLGMHDGSDVAGSGEGLRFVGIQKGSIRNRVDTANGVAVP